MKQVLMIAFHFPPYSGGSGIHRTLKFTRYLPEFGWEPVDIGGIEASHYLEATAMVWILNAMRNNDWNRALKLVPKA